MALSELSGYQEEKKIESKTAKRDLLAWRQSANKSSEYQNLYFGRWIFDAKAQQGDQIDTVKDYLQHQCTPLTVHVPQAGWGAGGVFTILSESPDI